MKSFAILALGATALAIPLAKRDYVYTTVVEDVYETVYTTTTVWVDPVPTAATSAAAGFYEEHPSEAPVVPTPATPTPVASTPTVVPAAPAYTPPAAPQVQAQAPPQPKPDTSSVAPYVPPAQPTTTAAAAPVASPPAPAYTPPTTTTAQPASGSYSGSGAMHTGDITYYDVSVGSGSCGTTASNSDAVVALSHLDMNNGANPNANPLCGKKINIHYNGATHSATVFDTCPTCAEGSLDLTQTLFNAVAPGGDGRVHGVTWEFA